MAKRRSVKLAITARRVDRLRELAAQITAAGGLSANPGALPCGQPLQAMTKALNPC